MKTGRISVEDNWENEGGAIFEPGEEGTKLAKTVARVMPMKCPECGRSATKFDKKRIAHQHILSSIAHEKLIPLLRRVVWCTYSKCSKCQNEEMFCPSCETWNLKEMPDEQQATAFECSCGLKFVFIA